MALTNVPRSRWNNYRAYQEQSKNNMAPGHVFPILYCTKHGERSLSMMKWGIVPHFLPRGAKHDHFKMFNARIETVESKASFRNIIKDQRCVVMINGFFEWKVGALGKKQPYYICRGDGLPLKLACIYEVRQEESESPLITFSIITCSTAASSLKEVHDRQPFFLTDQEVEQWIDNSGPPPTWLLSRHQQSNHWLSNSPPTNSSQSLPLEEQHPSSVTFDDALLVYYPVTTKMTAMSYQEDDVHKPLRHHLGITSFFHRKM